MQRPRRGTHLLRSFRVLFAEGSIASLSDTDLIRIFLTGHGEVAEAAFATLVERHGPMVLGVSRRILRDEHAAEDAFQTVFLILARKARYIRGDDALGRWLHGVTRRVAMRAKSLLSREIPAPPTSNDRWNDPVIAAVQAEVQYLISLEVARLPRKYKEVVALCHFDGLTHDAVAEALGLPVGTDRSRLTRARDLLRTRLARRGLAPAAFAAWFAARPAAANMPGALIEATLKTIGRDAAVAISPRVIVLSQYTMRSLSMTKAMAASALVFALGCMATGAVVLARGGEGSPKLPTEARIDSPPTGKTTVDDDPYAALRALLLDRPAPPVHLKHQLQAPQDAPRTLDGLKGKAVVLEFWGTWCGPCVAAIPHVNELVEKTRNEGVVFLTVTEEPKEQLTAFLAKTAFAARLGIDDKGMSTQAYHIKSWPTTVLIDPDGVVRGVMHPENLTVELVKDLAHRRPLPVPRGPAPTRPTAEKPASLNPDQAGFLVYVGPPGPDVGLARFGRDDMAQPETDARTLIQYCVREEAGGWYKSPRVLLECDLPERKLAYRVRVPEGSAVSPFALLRQAVEAAIGVRLRIDRESREQDVWVLVRVGTATPAAPEGTLDRGRTMYAKNYNIGENSHLVDIAHWVEVYRPGLRVLDETGLEGKYDWTLKVKSYELEDLNAALKPLGLALRPARRQVPYLVVRRSAAGTEK